jgi:5-formyltetrahydrofolate cyclo-ligase
VQDLDSEARAALVSQAKRELRRRMRALRQALPAQSAAARTARLVERLLALGSFASASSVALFWPMLDKREIDLRAVDAAARAANKAVYYPFMDPIEGGYRTGFRLTADPSELSERGRGFLEPPREAPAARRGDIGLVVVPALAVALDGHRLGYGAGFYDATLPDVCPPARSVAVAYSFQLLAELPQEEADIACDFVVTDDRSVEVPQKLSDEA